MNTISCTKLANVSKLVDITEWNTDNPMFTGATTEMWRIQDPAWVKRIQQRPEAFLEYLRTFETLESDATPLAKVDIDTQNNVVHFFVCRF